MSIEVDWQVVDEESQPPAQREAPPPPAKPRLRLPRWLWLKLVLPPILIAAALAACLAWIYRAQLNQVAEPVRLVARLEAQVVAADDRASFMALQDPNDAAWRALQEKRFGRLEHVGLPEFGWQAMDIRPVLGDVAQ